MSRPLLKRERAAGRCRSTRRADRTRAEGGPGSSASPSFVGHGEYAVIDPALDHLVYASRTHRRRCRGSRRWPVCGRSRAGRIRDWARATFCSASAGGLIWRSSARILTSRLPVRPVPSGPEGSTSRPRRHRWAGLSQSSQANSTSEWRRRGRRGSLRESLPPP